MKIWTEKQEAERLAARFAAVENRANFARLHKVPGGGAMIYQHIRGDRPISLEAAKAYARGFNVSLAEISPRLARSAEETLGLQSTSAGNIVIAEFDIAGRMGSAGMTLEGGHPDLIHSWNVSEQWARSNLPYYTSASNLRIITGYGDSNRGIYNSGDPLIIDAGITSVDRDAFYFFRLDGHGFIKMLQRMPHEGRVRIRAKSNNPLYEPFWIDETMDFEILGVVLKVWRGENL